MLLGETNGVVGGTSVGDEVARERVPIAFATHPAPWKFPKGVGVGRMMVI
jgi:hypothetical protein